LAYTTLDKLSTVFTRTMLC